MSSTRKIEQDLGTLASQLPSDRPILLRKDLEPVTELLGTLVCASEEILSEKLQLFRTFSIAKLIQVFTILKNSLPYQKPTLNVISLGCGTPDDFLALKLFLKKYNPNCVMNYVGLELDSTITTKSISEFQNHNNIKLITADATHLASIKEQLTSANALPEKGFDLILLRHPEILSISHGPLFERMLFSTIPFLAHDQSTIFASAYDFMESLFIKSILELPCYSSVSAFEWSGVASRNNVKGKRMEPESYSYIAHCAGMSLSSQREMIKDKVYHEIQLTESNVSLKNYSLKIISQGNYQQAFLFASSVCDIGFLKIFLNHKEELGIDIHQNSDELGNLALRNIEKSGVARQVKIDAMNLIAEHDNHRSACNRIMSLSC